MTLKASLEAMREDAALLWDSADVIKGACREAANQVDSYNRSVFGPIGEEFAATYLEAAQRTLSVLETAEEQFRGACAAMMEIVRLFEENDVNASIQFARFWEYE